MKKTIEFGYIKYEFEEGWGGGGIYFMHTKGKNNYNMCIVCGIEECVNYILQFCVGINAQRAALMISD